MQNDDYDYVILYLISIYRNFVVPDMKWMYRHCMITTGKAILSQRAMQNDNRKYFLRSIKDAAD